MLWMHSKHNKKRPNSSYAMTGDISTEMEIISKLKTQVHRVSFNPFQKSKLSKYQTITLQDSQARERKWEMCINRNATAADHQTNVAEKWKAKSGYHSNFHGASCRSEANSFSEKLPLLGTQALSPAGARISPTALSRPGLRRIILPAIKTKLLIPHSKKRTLTYSTKLKYTPRNKKYNHLLLLNKKIMNLFLDKIITSKHIKQFRKKHKFKKKCLIKQQLFMKSGSAKYHNQTAAYRFRRFCFISAVYSGVLPS